MEKLKIIEEIESEITDKRFLAFFRAFVKATQSKDYQIMKQLTFARWFLSKTEKLQFKYGIELAYKIVYKILNKRDYFYWERKALEELLFNI